MIKYRSRFEARYHRAYPNLEYEPVRLPYTLVHHYTPDFYNPDTNTYYETKGVWSSVDRTKLKLILAQHPGINIVMVFQNPNLTLSKKSRTTYSQWCDKHQIQWQTAR